MPPLKVSPEYKLHVIWSIKESTFMNTYAWTGIKSRKFQTTFPDDEYYICLWPHSYGKEEYSSIMVFESYNCWVKEMKLYIRSGNFEKDLMINKNDGKQPKSDVAFINREKLLGYFVDGILTLEFRGILCYEKEETKDMELGNFLWNKNDNKDFAFIVGDRKIMAHKFILRQFSSIIAADMNTVELQIENFSPRNVHDIVCLCYGIKISFDSLEKCLKLIEFTIAFDMPLIKERIEKEIKKFINAKNVCDLANISLKYDLKNLHSFCVNFLSESIKNGQPIYGNAADLNPEIAVAVFKKSLCHTQLC